MVYELEVPTSSSLMLTSADTYDEVNTARLVRKQVTELTYFDTHSLCPKQAIMG